MSIAPSTSILNAGVHPDRSGAWTVACIAKRTYVLDRGRCHPAEQQAVLVVQPEYDDAGELLNDSDVLLARRLVDVVVRGNAYAHDGSPEVLAAVCVGAARHIVRVLGDRQIESLRPVRFSEPERWDSMPLSWTRAYGGYDELAAAEKGDSLADLMKRIGRPYDPRTGPFAYARNPIGRGWFVESAREGERRLPNFEDPSHRLRPESIFQPDVWSWPRSPLPIGFGWLPHTFFPRCVHWSVPARPWNIKTMTPEDFPEVREGLLDAKDTDPNYVLSPSRPADLRAGQGAVRQLRLAALEPGADVRLENLHPKHPSFRFVLDVEVPRMIARMLAEDPVELTPRIRTLLIDPDAERVTVIWVGERVSTSPNAMAAAREGKHAVIWRGERAAAL